MTTRYGKWLVLVLCWLQFSLVHAKDDVTISESRQKLARAYEKSTRPLLARFCLGCHSTK